MQTHVALVSGLGRGIETREGLEAETVVEKTWYTAFVFTYEGVLTKTQRSSHVFWLCKIKLLKRDDLPSSKKFFQLTQLQIIPPEFSGHTQERALAQVYLRTFEVTCLLSGHTQDKDFQFPLVSCFLCGKTLSPFCSLPTPPALGLL